MNLPGDTAPASGPRNAVTLWRLGLVTSAAAKWAIEARPADGIQSQMAATAPEDGAPSYFRELLGRMVVQEVDMGCDGSERRARLVTASGQAGKVGR